MFNKKVYRSPKLKRLSDRKVRHLIEVFRSTPEFQRRLALLDEIWSQKLRKNQLPSSWQSQEAWEILIELYRSFMAFELPSIKQVQASTSLPQATMLRRLKTLESEGWIERIDCKDDRRVVLLRPTGKAIEVLHEWADARSDYLLGNQLAENTG